MAFNKLKFLKPSESKFSDTLKTRINHYFQANQISRHYNKSMVSKTVLMLVLFIGPIVVLNLGIITSVWLVFCLYILSGLGMAGVGMAVMHDAIHGSYSNNRKVNKYLSLTMNLIGANASVWKIQHNVLHHTYTNIEGLDDDINAPLFLRFSPNAKQYWIHKFQHFYVWFFYGLSTISWITTKDFVRINRYRKMGFFKKKNEFSRELIKLTGWKIFYYAFALVLPLIFIPLSPWIILLAFLSMHFLTGFLISIIFQVAHVMPTTKYVDHEGAPVINNDWYIHQMQTTANYSPKSRIFSWIIGGLNFQIEHHLFPNICHVHYRKLSKIIKQTAQEFDIPYNTYHSFGAAIKHHIKMLAFLGKPAVKIP